MTVLFHLQIMTFNTCISYSFCTISFSIYLIDCIYTLFFLRKMISWIKFCARNKFTYIHVNKILFRAIKREQKEKFLIFKFRYVFCNKIPEKVD